MKLKKTIPWAITGFFLVAMFLPFFWLLTTSVKSIHEAYQVPIVWIPSVLTVSNFQAVFRDSALVRNIFNSIVIASFTVIICVVLGGPAAYTFSRRSYRGDRLLLLFIIGSRFLPPVSFVIPYYLLIHKVNLINTYWALIIINTYFNLPFVIWILIGFFRTIPGELEEAAKIDGASNLAIFLKIFLPLGKIGISASAIMAFLFTWNEFLFSSMLTTTDEARPLTVGLTNFLGDTTIAWTELAAGGTLALIPSFAFALAFQRHIIRGLTTGAIK
jgi:ABC-type glycerol-3-phosphate transport system permease component